MKNGSVLTCLIFIFFYQLTTTRINNPTHYLPDEMCKKYLAILDGNWVNSTYIDEVKKTQSPYKTYGKFGVVELHIRAKKVRKTITVEGMTLHEGGYGFKIYLQAGITDSTLPTSWKDYTGKSKFSELGYEISGKDTFLIVYHYDKHKKVINQDKFTKCPDFSDGSVQYEVNKIMFAGIYSTTIKDKTTQIELTSDGKVRNFMKFKEYFVVLDFAAGEWYFDHLVFDMHTKNQKAFAYRLIDRKLVLYEIDANKDYSDKPFVFNKPRYEFVKQ